jgi:hydrogenase maturation protease
VSRTLIIGFGNPLRGDDGIGPAVARRCAGRHPDVECLTPLQLHPEHADAMRGRDIVLFVDASVGSAEVRIAPVGSAEGGRWTAGHGGSPAALSALCSAMYPDPPGRVFLLEIPAHSFDLGRHLTPMALQHARHAEALIEELIPELSGAA